MLFCCDGLLFFIFGGLFSKMEETSVEVAFSLHYIKQKCAIHKCCMLFTVHKNEEQLYESLPILEAG